MINLACKRATPAALARMQDALHAMSEARSATRLGLSWYPLQRELATAADSPLLHIVAQYLTASLLLRRLHSAELPEAGARELLEASRTIAGNVARGKVRGNREAHWRCQDVLVRHW
jgi:DNA-binding FadR family transcriptional regulator